MSNKLARRVRAGSNCGPVKTQRASPGVACMEIVHGEKLMNKSTAQARKPARSHTRHSIAPLASLITLEGVFLRWVSVQRHCGTRSWIGPPLGQDATELRVVHAERLP